MNRRFKAFRKVAFDPQVYIFSGLGSVGAYSQYSRSINGYSSGVYPAVKSNRIGCPSGLRLGPLVGGNNSMTGAVCNISCGRMSVRTFLSGHLPIRALYFLKGPFSIGKIQGPIQDPALSLLVTFYPALAK